MALVKEFKIANGATVRIFDDEYRGVPPEEIARRWQRVNDEILKIDRNARMRELAAQKAAQQAATGD